MRFSNCVSNYVRFRPTYPPELIAHLAARTHLSPTQSTIADIGSGTGILTALLVPLAAHVYAVEPNGPMRTAAEQRFAGMPVCTSINGTAEATTLSDHSVNLITAAQSFHWFDKAAARREFSRILKSDGHIALIWNERQTSGTDFLDAYETFLCQYATDYASSRRALISEADIIEFFAPAKVELFEHPVVQSLDLSGFIGRTLSSSYAPPPAHPGHQSFVASLQTLFAHHAKQDRVDICYRARLYLSAP